MAGQRFFDANGNVRQRSMSTGVYQFETLHQDGAGHLIALRTGPVDITGPTNIDLQPVDMRPVLTPPPAIANSAAQLDEFSIRSSCARRRHQMETGQRHSRPSPDAFQRADLSRSRFRP